MLWLHVPNELKPSSVLNIFTYYIHLVVELSGQVKNHCYGSSSLILGWQTAHDVLHVRKTFLCRRWFSH